MPQLQRIAIRLVLALAGLLIAEQALSQAEPPPESPSTAGPSVVRVTCTSSPGGERRHCPGNTGSGVLLARSLGDAPCLLGKSWGYDDAGVWVSDGCAAEFVLAPAPPAPSPPAPSPPAAGEPVAAEPEEEAEPAAKKGSPEYIPNAGFRLFEGEMGQIYMRLFSYARYLNQDGLDPTYTDAFGNTFTLDRREDVQLNKFFLPFSGWFITPKFRYYLYVWSSNPSQGDPAQVVGAGNLSWVFNRHVTVGAGITSLPSVRSTEGQFPYWLTVDNRLISDEFFRGSYTSGVWVKGEISTKVKYMAMLANNLSTLGVSASQIDNKLDTTSLMLQWLPTTGEFGLWGTFGDYDHHETVATRLSVHYTSSTEEKQSQPGTNGIENSQIRLTDGSVIFTSDLFGPGITVDQVDYEMSSFDAGIKYRGFSLEFELYWRWLSNYQGTNTSGIADIDDHGYQVQVSAMLVPKTVQLYAGAAEIKGEFGDASELRAGVNWYPLQTRGIRLNAQWIHLDDCPVGYTAVPYPVGGNGDVISLDLEMNF